MNIDISKLKPAKKYILVVIVCLILMYLLYFVATHGFVTLDYNTGNNSTVTIVDSDNKTRTVQSYESSKKIFLKKGEYNFSVKEGNDSGFIVANTVGFLSTKKISVNLKPAANIVVAATVNNGCIDINKGVVYEYSCYGSDYISKTEVATVNRPAYANTITLGDSILYGSTTTKNGTQIQIKKYIFNEYDTANKYTLLINGTDKININYELGDNIGITNYMDGFVIYSKDKSIAYIYDSPNNKPSIIDFKLSDDNQDAVVGTMVKGNYITQYVVASNDVKVTSNNNKNIAYYDGKEVKSITLSEYFNIAVVCDTSRLCTMGNGFSVYDISGDTPQEISKVFDGQNMVSGNDDLFVATSNNILKASFNESVQYDVIDSYSSANSCGLYYFETIYGCRVVSELNRNLLVKYDLSTPKTEDIIMQLSELSKHKDIDVVTINNQYIFINAKYPTQIGASNINPEVKASIIQSINNAIDEQKIDRTKYTIRIL